MACKNSCRLCDRLRISQSVTFAGGNLVINLPAGSYDNGGKYCIIIAQAIPDTTTVNAPVFVTIGGGAELYPLTKKNCAQVTACAVRTRTRYATRVSTTTTGGSFKLLGDVCCVSTHTLDAIDGTAPAAPGA